MTRYELGHIQGRQHTTTTLKTLWEVFVIYVEGAHSDELYSLSLGPPSSQNKWASVVQMFRHWDHAATHCINVRMCLDMSAMCKTGVTHRSLRQQVGIFSSHSAHLHKRFNQVARSRVNVIWTRAVATPGIFIGGGGALAHRVWRTEVPQWDSAPNPSMGSGDRSRPEAEAVCRHCLQILTAETIKIWTFRTIHRVILDHYVLRGELSDISGISPPSPCLAPPLNSTHRVQTNSTAGDKLRNLCVVNN